MVADLVLKVILLSNLGTLNLSSIVFLLSEPITTLNAHNFNIYVLWKIKAYGKFFLNVK